MRLMHTRSAARACLKYRVTLLVHMLYSHRNISVGKQRGALFAMRNVFEFDEAFQQSGEWANFFIEKVDDQMQFCPALFCYSAPGAADSNEV